MGGVDASAGFAFQHAQAVQMALIVAADPNFHTIRVEGNSTQHCEWGLLETNVIRQMKTTYFY